MVLPSFEDQNNETFFDSAAVDDTSFHGFFIQIDNTFYEYYQRESSMESALLIIDLIRSYTCKNFDSQGNSFISDFIASDLRYGLHLERLEPVYLKFLIRILNLAKEYNFPSLAHFIKLNSERFDDLDLLHPRILLGIGLYLSRKILESIPLKLEFIRGQLVHLEELRIELIENELLLSQGYVSRQEVIDSLRITINAIEQNMWKQLPGMFLKIQAGEIVEDKRFVGRRPEAVELPELEFCRAMNNMYEDLFGRDDMPLNALLHNMVDIDLDEGVLNDLDNTFEHLNIAPSSLFVSGHIGV